VTISKPPQTQKLKQSKNMKPNVNSKKTVIASDSAAISKPPQTEKLKQSKKMQPSVTSIKQNWSVPKFINIKQNIMINRDRNKNENY